MVQFSNIVITDRKIRTKVRSRPKETRFEDLHLYTEKDRQSPGGLSDTHDAGDIRAYYKLLLLRVDALKRQNRNDRQHYSHLIISIFRHILEHNLLDEIQGYADSIPPGTHSSASHLASLALAHLKAGIDMGYSTEQILKTGFDVITQDSGSNGIPESILQEDVSVSPDKTTPVEKRTGLIKGTLAHVISENATAEDSFQEPKKHPQDQFTGLDKGETDKMENPDDALTEMEPFPGQAKRTHYKWFIGIIILLALGGGAIWFTGILPMGKGKESPAVATHDNHSGAIKKMIVAPADTAEPERLPSNDSPPVQEALSAPQKEEIPLAETITPEEKPSPESAQPPPPAGVSPIETPPGPIEKYPYSLHVGSFQTIGRAREAMAELTKEGLSPYWVRVDLGEKGSWYRILVGHFGTTGSADQFLKDHGLTVARVLKTGYAVREGIYSSKTEANERIQALEKAGFCPYSVTYAENRHELLVGAYQNKKDALKTAAELETSGLSGEVVLR